MDIQRMISGVSKLLDKGDKLTTKIRKGLPREEELMILNQCSKSVFCHATAAMGNPEYYEKLLGLYREVIGLELDLERRHRRPLKPSVLEELAATVGLEWPIEEAAPANSR